MLKKLIKSLIKNINMDIIIKRIMIDIENTIKAYTNRDLNTFTKIKK